MNGLLRDGLGAVPHHAAVSVHLKKVSNPSHGNPSVWSQVPAVNFSVNPMADVSTSHITGCSRALPRCPAGSAVRRKEMFLGAEVGAAIFDGDGALCTCCTCISPTLQPRCWSSREVRGCFSCLSRPKQPSLGGLRGEKTSRMHQLTRGRLFRLGSAGVCAHCSVGVGARHTSWQQWRASGFVQTQVSGSGVGPCPDKIWLCW